VNEIWKLNLKTMTVVMEMQNAYSALDFSRMTSMAENGLNVSGAIVGRMKTAGLRKTALCAPCAEKL